MRSTQLRCTGIFIFLLGLALVPRDAYAGVIINISEAIGGTRFEISGNVTIASGVTGDLNGFWLDAELSGVPFMTGVNPTITHGLLTGSGSITTTSNGLATIGSTQVFPTFAFAINTSPSLTYEIGNTFTLSGDFTTSQPFGNFIPGTYSDIVIGIYGARGTDSPVTLNIAGTAVPEPSSTALFAVGTLTLLGYRRARRHTRNNSRQRQKSK